jgi:hypothetical protein
MLISKINWFNHKFAQILKLCYFNTLPLCNLKKSSEKQNVKSSPDVADILA